MKLRLSPSGTLWPTLAMSCLSVVFLPVALMAGERLVDGAMSIGSDETPSIGALAFGLFFLGCVGPLIQPALYPLRGGLTDFEKTLPLTRARVLGERAVRLLLALTVPILLAAMLMAGAEVLGLRVWESLHGARWPLSLFLVPPLLAVLGHALFTFVLFTWWKSRPPEDTAFRASTVSEEEPARATRWLSRTNRVLLRSTLLRPKVRVGLALFAALPIVSTLLGVYGHFPYFLTLVAAMTLTPQLANMLEGTDALPISRSRTLPWLVGPSLVVTLIAAGTTSLFDVDSPYQPGVPLYHITLDRNPGEAGPRIQVPPYLWCWAETQADRTIESPWGETWEADEVRVLRFSSGLYNPYGAGPENSVRFARWQMGRAAAAAGRAYSADELQAMVLPKSDAEVILDSSHARLYERPSLEVPGLPWHRRLAGLRPVLLILLWGLGTLAALRSKKPKRGVGALPEHPIARHVLLFVALLAVTLIPIGLGEQGSALFHSAERWLDRLLGGSTFAWYTFILSLSVALYLWIRRGFLRTETPPAAEAGMGRSPAPIF